jgi:Zn-dependent protease with chaperone function
MTSGDVLRGELFDGVTAAAVPVTVTLAGSGELHIRGPRSERRVALAACTLSPPLGRTPRIIGLPDGASIETRDLEVLAAWESFHRRSRGGHFVNALESRWRSVLAAVGVLVLVAVAAYVWGLPLAASAVAFNLPTRVDVAIGEHAQPIIERQLGLRPTKLTAERQAALSAAFEELATSACGDEFPWALQFRDAPALGPNAIALPSGTILVTDQLVALAQRDEEVLAVLAHELTHVQRRHGVRSALQNSGVGFLLGLMLGDISSATTLGVSLPAVLAQAGYSRDFEREADRGAAAICRQRGWGTEPLRVMFERLGQAAPGTAGLSWIASHPDIEDRIRALDE